LLAAHPVSGGIKGEKWSFSSFWGKFFFFLLFLSILFCRRKKFPLAVWAAMKQAVLSSNHLFFGENKLSKYKLEFWAISFGICLLKLISILRLCSSSFFRCCVESFFIFRFQLIQLKMFFRIEKKSWESSFSFRSFLN
jgi:hypothetical protein